MNLIIDVGNTFIKLAVFKNNLLIKKINTSKEKFFEDFERISIEHKNLINVIISLSVSGLAALVQSTTNPTILVCISSSSMAEAIAAP